MTRLLGVVVLASALALAAAGHPQPGSAAPGPDSYSYKILNAPTSSDERAIRTQGLIPTAQKRSNSLFSALISVLGGTAPQLNFVPTGSPLTPNYLSANIAANPGGPAGTINMNPLAVEGLINDASPYHSGVVNQVPHEMSHLRQVTSVLGDPALREGGAQAFADLVTPEAARRAGIQYTDGNFDGGYSSFVKAARAKGNDWLLGGQFGKQPVAWP